MKNSALSILALTGLLFASHATAGPTRYTALQPCRAINSLHGIGVAANTLLVNGEARWFNLRGRCNVPLDATGVAINVTVVGPGGGLTQHGGYLNVFDAGLVIEHPHPVLPTPETSVINWQAGQQAVANFHVVNFESGSRRVKIFAAYGGVNPVGVHVIVDVLGYFK